MGMSSLLPHAQGTRQVIRILQLKAIRELDRQDVAAAIGSLEAGLRLSRDLRPRGIVITQSRVGGRQQRLPAADRRS